MPHQKQRAALGVLAGQPAQNIAADIVVFRLCEKQREQLIQLLLEHEEIGVILLLFSGNGGDLYHFGKVCGVFCRFFFCPRNGGGRIGQRFFDRCGAHGANKAEQHGHAEKAEQDYDGDGHKITY